MVNRAAILKSDGLEGLYINGRLVEESRMLNQGMNRVLYILLAAEKFNFYPTDIETFLLEDEDCEYVDALGCFPSRIEELDGDYTVLPNKLGCDDYDPDELL